MTHRPVIVLVCRHTGRADPPPVVPLGRMIDYRTERRQQWQVITDADLAADREMVEQLTPGEPLRGYAQRGGRVIDWSPMLYRGPAGELVESPAPRRIVGATNGDTWTFDCPDCDRRPEVNEATFGKLFDAFVKLLTDPRAVGEIEFSKGQPVVDLSVIEDMISNTPRRRRRAAMPRPV